MRKIQEAFKQASKGIQSLTSQLRTQGSGVSDVVSVGESFSSMNLPQPSVVVRYEMVFCECSEEKEGLCEKDDDNIFIFPFSDSGKGVLLDDVKRWFPHPESEEVYHFFRFHSSEIGCWIDETEFAGESLPFTRIQGNSSFLVIAKILRIPKNADHFAPPARRHSAADAPRIKSDAFSASDGELFFMSSPPKKRESPVHFGNFYSSSESEDLPPREELVRRREQETQDRIKEAADREAERNRKQQQFREAVFSAQSELQGELDRWAFVSGGGGYRDIRALLCSLQDVLWKQPTLGQHTMARVRPNVHSVTNN